MPQTSPNLGHPHNETRRPTTSNEILTEGRRRKGKHGQNAAILCKLNGKAITPAKKKAIRRRHSGGKNEFPTKAFFIVVRM